MYKLLLILKYLHRKLAPLFAAVAVMLCTAMVIIVISVMGGFLSNLRDSVRSGTGDVIVDGGSYAGFAHYQQLVDELERQPEIAAATPVIHSYGLLQLYGRTFPIRVQGIDPATYARVMPWKEWLVWDTDDRLRYFDQEVGDVEAMGKFERRWHDAQRKRVAESDLVEAATAMTVPDEWQAGGDDDDAATETTPGELVPRVAAGRREAVVPGFYLMRRGGDARRGEPTWDAFTPVGEPGVLTVVPVDQQGGMGGPSARRVTVVNEAKTGNFEYDAGQVYVSFDVLQRMMAMEAVAAGLTLSGEAEPGRASEVLVKAAAGHSVEQARAAAERAAEAARKRHPEMGPLFVSTWEQQGGGILAAVENERGLVTFLFAVISLVAVVMVATTFYMTVLEKTRDIGTLRALGASRGGVLMMFLGYGFAVGLVGAVAGGLLAWAIVTHLNEIQAAITDLTGWRMWDPSLYMFDRIPDRVRPLEAMWIVLAAIASSVIGALIPAVLAARLDPIVALRYE